MTIWAVVLSCVTMLTSWAGLLLPEASSAEPLRIEVSAGFDGYYQPGKWLPVRVYLENTAAAIEGQLVMSLGERRLALPVSLPAPTKKQLYFEVLVHGAPQVLSLSLVAGETALATVWTHLTALPAGHALVVVLADEAWPGAGLLRRYGLRSEHRVVRPLLAELPNSWKGYESVTAVILETPRADALSSAQRQALTRWLLLGGRVLVVDQEPGRRASAWYHQLGNLPVPEHAAADERFIVVEVGLGNLLLVRASSPPVREVMTLPLPAVWYAWLGSESARLSLALLDRQIMQRLPVLPGENARPVRGLGLCMALYAGTVAVLLGVVRPTLARPWWGYIAVGGMSLVLAWLACWVGDVVYPGALVSQELALVHVFPRQSEVYITTSATLLSPAPRHYHVETASAAAYIEVVEAAGEEGQLPYAFDSQHTPASAQLHMHLWAKRRLFLERFTTSPGFFSAPEETANQVVNRSSFDLQNCHVLTRSGVYRLPDIRAGHTWRFRAQEYTASPGSLQTRGQPELLARVLSRYGGTMAVSEMADRLVCSTTGMVPGVSSPAQKMRHMGATVLVYHLTHQTRG